jgi:alkenylglycerophosphocholine/alkenylglycerophosphoethanolamine hydrolase
MTPDVGTLTRPEILTGAVLACALAAIASEGRRRLPIFYFLKPLTTIMILALTLSFAGVDVDYRSRVVVGMVFCLGGDIALLGRSDRAFIVGVGMFMISHLLFISALADDLPSLIPPPWTAVIVPFVILGVVVLWPRVGSLRAPVLAYTLALIAMWFVAAGRVEAFGTLPTIYAIAGASIFVVSDSTLGFQRFVVNFRGADAVVLSTYWLAMTLLAWSVAGSGAA